MTGITYPQTSITQGTPQTSANIYNRTRKHTTFTHTTICSPLYKTTKNNSHLQPRYTTARAKPTPPRESRTVDPPESRENRST